MLAAVQVINKLLQTKDYNFIKINSLDVTYFQGYEDEYNFIIEHYKKFGNIPDMLTFVGQFQSFIPTEVNETFDYLLDKLQEERGYNKFATFLPELDRLAKQDSRLAYNYLVQELTSLKPHTVCKGKDIIANGDERYQTYIEKQNAGEKATISTGLVELDSIIGGWEFGEELVTVVARTNQGKSWILLKFLTEAWKQGYRVGLYSGEMSHIKLGFRFDALYEHFSNLALVRGHQVDGYREYLDKLKTIPNPFYIITQKEFGGRPTVQQIRNFVEENKIEVMGIDQYSLMADGRAKMKDPPRIQLGHIAEDLFLLSTDYKIPIIGLAQANRESVKKENELDAPGLENIKESDDIAHNSSKVIGIRQTPLGLVMDINKNREGKVGDKLMYEWKIDTGHFTYIPTYQDNVSSSIKEEIRQKAAPRVNSVASVNPF